MFASFCFCILIAAVYSFQQSLAIQSTDKDAQYRNEEMTVSSSKQREKRVAVSLIGRGLKALETLLDGARQIDQNLVEMGVNYRRYQQTGDYDTALRTFRSLKPRNVRPLISPPNALMGKVGDRTLVIQPRGWQDKPQIMIWKEEMPNYVDIINYKTVQRANQARY